MQIKKNWPTTELLGISVDCCSQQELLRALEAYCLLPDTQPLHLITMNAEMAYAATQDPKILAVLQQADLIIPDGAGVVWGLGWQGVPVKRLPGVELVEALLKQSNQLKIYVLGSSQETLAAFQAKIELKYPLANIVGLQHGYFKEEELPQIISQINQVQPHILLVALGVPKQEFWIARYRSELKVPLMMGIGGSLDVLSGQLKRAPLWMQQAHLEWLYRLVQQPQRWRRMLALPKYVVQVINS